MYLLVFLPLCYCYNPVRNRQTLTELFFFFSFLLYWKLLVELNAKLLEITFFFRHFTDLCSHNYKAWHYLNSFSPASPSTHLICSTHYLKTSNLFFFFFLKHHFKYGSRVLLDTSKSFNFAGKSKTTGKQIWGKSHQEIALTLPFHAPVIALSTWWCIHFL